MIGILASTPDSASMAIRDALDAHLAWTDENPRRSTDGAFAMWTTERRHLEIEHPERAHPAIDRLIVVSKHAGETGRLLTAHPPGNVASADHGGEPRTLPPADPALLDAILAALAETAPEAYDVGMECTHHGPTAVDVPITFVEIGSGEAAWTDQNAAEAVARAIASLPERLADAAPRSIAGFGGGHYVPRFERIQRETSWAVGHVAADWSLEALGDPREHPEILEAVLEQSGAEVAVIDGDRPSLRAALEASDRRVVSETWLRAADGVPIDRIDALEAALCPIDVGLQVGDRAAEVAEWSIATIPGPILDRARAIDPAAAAGILREACVAVERSDDRATGRVAVGPAGPPIDALLAVIDREATVRREDDAVVIEQRVFDPDRARELGVPEGPAYGRLADGNPVECDGERIDPDAVHRTERIRVPIEPDCFDRTDRD